MTPTRAMTKPDLADELAVAVHGLLRGMAGRDELSWDHESLRHG